MVPMSNPNNEIHREFLPWFRLYKDGRVERFIGTDTTIAGIHPLTTVQSKDITIDPQTGLSARLFLPRIIATDTAVKLPLLVYIHGGAFCVGSAFNDNYHHQMNNVSADGNVVILSVNYRLAPEHPLPIAYDDTWAAIQWALDHSNGHGKEPWLNNHADFTRMYFAGDSAGAMIAHNMAMRIGFDDMSGSKLVGIVLIHPSFRNGKRDEMLEFIFPTMGGPEDPRINPTKDPNLRRLGCQRVLVMVAEKDFYAEGGRDYYNALKKSEWKGSIDLVEAESENHVFHLMAPEKPTAKIQLKQFVSFLNQIKT